MAKIRFRAAEYELPTEFTNREMIDIERVSGASAGQIYEAMKAGHVSWAMIVALASTAIARGGGAVSLDELLDANLDDLELMPDTEEPDAGPLDESAAESQAEKPAAVTTETRAVSGAQR